MDTLTPTFTGQRDARDFRIRHDDQARRLTRMTKVELKNLLDRQDRADGIQRWGGPSSKDELIRELIQRDFPLARLNESIHVLYHGPGETWSACKWCHPHNGTECECGQGN